MTADVLVQRPELRRQLSNKFRVHPMFCFQAEAIGQKSTMAIALGTTSQCSACNCSESHLSKTGTMTGVITHALIMSVPVVYCYSSLPDFELS